MTGFPVEVGIFSESLVQTRDDTIYEFRFTPDTTNYGIFCDSEGERPNSIAWGMSLKPVLNTPIDESHIVVQQSAIYFETTGPELQHFIACLQNLYDVNFKEKA